MSGKLSPEQISEGKQLRSNGWTWLRLKERYFVSETCVRRNIDPMFGKRYKVKQNFWNDDSHEKVERNPTYDPRRDGYRAWESPSAYLCGEPEIGRRAIDMR